MEDDSVCMCADRGNGKLRKRQRIQTEVARYDPSERNRTEGF